MNGILVLSINCMTKNAQAIFYEQVQFINIRISFS